MKLLQEIIEYKDFFHEFTLQQLRSRYRGSILGFLWTLLNPLLLFATFTFIFTYINHTDARTFIPMFFGGYIPWLFFTKVADSAVGSVVGNAVFFTRILVPRGVFPLAAVAVNILEFVATLVVALGIMAAAGAPFHLAMLILPLSMAVLLVFVTGIAFLFALLNVFFRDFGFLWASISFLWFFLTPILYPIENLSPGAQQLVRLNPFLPFLDLFQQPISKGIVPGVDTWIFACTLAALSIVAGTAMYQNKQRRFYEYL